MQICSAIDLDCSELVSHCDQQCERCFDEISTTLCGLEGVCRTHIEQRNGERRLVVEHDPTLVVAGQLANEVEQLPTFLDGAFAARLIAR